MDLYFIHNGKEETGPFAPGELKSKGVTASTPVWREGFDDWIAAGEVPELKDYILKTPPPFKAPAAVTEKPVEVPGKSRKFWKWVAIVICTLAIGFAAFKYFQDPSSKSKNTEQSPEDLKNDLSKIEEQNPSQYLDIDGANMHNNLFGRKIIKGNIVNTSATTTFKDVQIQVVFTSKTETELKTEQFTVYEYVAPNNSVKFRKVFDAPAGTEGFKIGVIDARANN